MFWIIAAQILALTSYFVFITFSALKCSSVLFVSKLNTVISEGRPAHKLYTATMVKSVLLSTESTLYGYTINYNKHWILHIYHSGRLHHEPGLYKTMLYVNVFQIYFLVSCQLPKSHTFKNCIHVFQYKSYSTFCAKKYNVLQTWKRIDHCAWPSFNTRLT